MTTLYTASTFVQNLDQDLKSYETSFMEHVDLKNVKKEQPDKYDKKQNTKMVDDCIDPEEGVFNTDDFSNSYRKFYPPFNHDENPYFLTIIYADEQGNIKWLDLTSFIRDPLQKLKDAQLREELTRLSKPDSEKPPYVYTT